MHVNITQPTLAGSNGSSDVFLLEYDYDGRPVAGWKFGGSNTDTVADLQTDAFGGLYLAGATTTSGGISFAPIPNLSVGNGNYLARLMTVRFDSWMCDRRPDV